MGLFGSSRPTLLKIGQSSLTLKTLYFSRLFLIPSLFFLFVFFPPFSQIAVAAPSSPEEKNIQNPNITFEKGLLSVQVEGVKIKALMQAISRKAGLLAHYNIKRGGKGYH